MFADRIILLFLSLSFFLWASDTLAQSTPDPGLTRELREYMIKARKNLEKENADIHFSVFRVPDRQEVFSVGADSFVHGASVQKLFITYAALKILGADYTIPTEFYSDFLPQDRNPGLDLSVGLAPVKNVPEDSLGRLYVRAYGNPTLQYRDMIEITRELKARGLNGVTDLVIDDSLFIEKSEPAGSDSYQAAQSATSVEFNTYRVQITPAASGLSPLVFTSPGLFGEVRNRSKSLSGKGNSLEITQNPPNELFTRFSGLGELVPQPVTLHVSGRIGLQQKYWEKYYAHPDPFLLYSLSLRNALVSQGIQVQGSIMRGVVPAEAHSLYVHESEPLYSILAKLNRYSNNFIAGQLLYLLGQDSKGFFSSKRGMDQMKELLDDISCMPSGAIFDDASGLSGKNRISSNQVVNLLNEVQKDLSISPVFVSSLSRFGISGTLKNRELFRDPPPGAARSPVFREEQRRVQGVWAKTGTVEGVSGLAGYLDRYEGFRLAFSLIIAGSIEKNRAVEIENDIIRILLGRK